MFNVIKIGEKEVPMLAMASAAIYYKRVFGRDAIITQADAKTDGETIAFYSEMGYIMAMMAKYSDNRAKLNEINLDSYIDWLDQFEASDYNEAIIEIAKIYEGQNKVTSKEKKESAH